MMVFVQILPLALIVLIISLYLKSRNKNLSVKPRKPRRKMVRMIFTVYASVLFISMMLYYILPVSADDTLSQRAEEYEGWKVHEKATQNKFDEIDPEFLAEQKEFDYSLTSLVFPESYYENGDPVFVVTIDEKLSNQILMDVYKTPFTLNGLDITDEVKRPEVSITNNLVEVSNVYEQNDLYYIQFTPSIAVEQFLSEERQNLSSGFSYSYGVTVVHLRVPKEVAIIGDVLQFQAQ
ncbi:hypothetical protein [Jeotgalibacillus salarius]|uniref:Uncharacterized protein n=1 Tax=Jeotgalibacillus salarius TaxID=546023 RepID=A0A4Y8LGW7_9BACL|nr:hypothetical protein [Jeotgalibacillus salarius]TFE02066.1 hypothetical protein E2626_05690 [Jeotgalibacillus salarius]